MNDIAIIFGFASLLVLIFWGIRRWRKKTSPLGFDFLQEAESFDSFIQEVSVHSTAVHRALKAQAEYESRHNRRLDYSFDSIKTVERVCSDAHREFAKSYKKGQSSRDMVAETTRIWGSYLGEVIRQTFNGYWAKEEVGNSQERTILKMGGHRFDPFMAVYKRIIEGDKHNLWSMFRNARKKLDSFAKAEEKRIKEYQRLLAHFQHLKNSHNIWHVKQNKANKNMKQNAGAANLISRQPVKIIQKEIPSLNTTVFGLAFDHTQMYFFPNKTYRFRRSEFGTDIESISYNSIYPAGRKVTVIENQPEKLPADASVKGYTYQYVNKDGTRDKRYKENKKLPKIEYGQIQFAAVNPDHESKFYISNHRIAQKFAEALATYINTEQGIHRSQFDPMDMIQQQKHIKDQATKELDSLQPHEVLQIPRNATMKEVTAAYRNMAQLYHPDKMSSYAQEFQDLAQLRMSAINQAYSQMKSIAARKFR